jgi:hypothetical protein
MANMSYSRFANTLADLKDCQEHMDDSPSLSSEESKYRRRLISLCVDISLDYGDEIDREVKSV